MKAMSKIPYHIAIIMDGNGRWAKKRLLPRTLGHKEGVKRVRETVKEAKRLGVKILTIFAFSTENWKRPKKEIDSLFSYLDKFLEAYQKELIEGGIKLNVIGRKDRINKQTLEKIEKLALVTNENKSFIFNIALDYGGRWDIVNAAKNIAGDYQNKKINIEDLDEKLFGQYLSLNSMPDPDLLIRTSGDKRMSNFLIWNLAYSEFYFTSTLWPDFNKKQLIKAIEAYSQRDRRFGEIDE